MKAERREIEERWLRTGSLVAAGTLSLFLTTVGLVALGWAGLGYGDVLIMALCRLLPLLLAVIIFVSSVAIYRPISFASWVMVLMHWIALAASAYDAKGIFTFLKQLGESLVAPTTILLLVFAALLQFGIQVVRRPLIAVLCHRFTWLKSERLN